MHAMALALACLIAFPAGAATWTVHVTDQDGMTPSQQLTNAVTQAAAGDTIKFEAGTYQLDGESFTGVLTGSGSGSVTVTNRNYVFAEKRLYFVGASTAKWDDATILRGNGNDRFFLSDVAGSTFRGLTFENFASNDRLNLQVDGNNLSRLACGGAICYYSGANATGPNEANLVSNCVFRFNQSRSAGAVNGVVAQYCLFTNNFARSYGGGAASLSTMDGCLCVDNMATNSGCFGGAIWWARGTIGLKNSTFVGNRSKTYAGAVVGEGEMVMSNCVLRGNMATGAPSDNYWAAGGGAMVLRPNSRILYCTFEGNSANGKGGVVNTTNGSNGGRGSVFDHCTFTGNTSGDVGGVAYDATKDADTPLKFLNCTFSGNYAKNSSMAVYCGVCSNCTFTAHYATNTATSCGVAVGAEARMLEIVDCVFSNNYNIYNGMVRYANCTNTLFYGNEVPNAGGVVKRCRAVDCRFVGNRKYDTKFNIVVPYSYSPTPSANLPSGDATESTLVKCDLDLGCILNCVLTDCHIHTLTNKGAHCVFYGHNVATNCLIEGCNPPDQARGIIYRWGPVTTSYVTGSDYVNCTFAGNVFPRFYLHQQEYGIYTPFKNCLFYSNRTRSGTLVDARFRVKDTNRGDLSNLDSGMALSNCVFGVVESEFDGDTWHDLGGNKTIAPSSLLVAGSRAGSLGVHKYALRPESPAIGMGDASMFAATDLDYAGNLRLREGRLDPGCFECWLNIQGTYIIVR